MYEKTVNAIREHVARVTFSSISTVYRYFADGLLEQQDEYLKDIPSEYHGVVKETLRRVSDKAKSEAARYDKM